MSRVGREARLVALSRLIWGFADGMLVLTLPLYLTELAASPGDVGSVLGLGNAVGSMLVLPAGFLAQRIGRRWVIGIGSAAGFLGSLSYLALGSWSGAFLAAAIYFTSLVALPQMNAHLATHEPRSSLGRAMGFSYAVSMIGLIAAPTVAGALGSSLGLRAPIVAAAIGYAALMGTAPLLRRSGPSAPVTTSPNAIPRTYWAVMGGVLIAVAIFNLPVVLAPLYLRDALGASLPIVGLYLTAMNLGAAILAAATGYLVDRVGPLASIAAAALLLSAGALAVGASSPIVAVGMFLLGAQVGVNPALAALVGRILPAARLSIGFTTLQLTTRMGIALAAVLAGWLYEADARLPMLAGAALTLPAAIGIVFIARRAITPKRR